MGEGAVPECHPLPEASETFPGRCQSRRITIEPQQSPMRCGALQDGLCVTPTPHCPVHGRAARLHLEEREDRL